MFFKKLLQSSTVRLALIALVLCSVTLVGSRSTGEAKAAVQLTASSPMEQDATTAVDAVPNMIGEQTFIKCTVHSVGTNYVYNTTGIWSKDCSPSTGAIQYFFVPADSKKANQILSIALMAQATGRQITMIYDPSDTTGIPSDLVGNNRKLLTMGLNP